MIAQAGRTARPTSSCHEAFLKIVPAIERYCRLVFRKASAEAREEAVAEAIALAYQAYLSLVRRGRAPVPETVRFRVDFSEWLAGLSSRNRAVAESLAMSHSTGEVARRFGLSPGRISQLRGEFRQSWSRFEEEPDSPQVATTA